MTKEFVSYEQAVALKELGFDEKCLTTYIYKGGLNSIWNVMSYQIENEYLFENTCNDLWNRNSTNKNDCISAPLKVQVFKWFQENNLWFHTISYHRKAYPNTNQFKWKVDIGLDLFDCKGWSDTYEQAEDACIDKLIELSKQQ